MSFFKKSIVGLMVASSLVGVQAQAQIQTFVIHDGANIGPKLPLPRSDAMKNFSKDTPCYIHGAKKHPSDYAKFVQIFKDAGFNITDDESVDCEISVGGWIHSDSGGETLYSDDPNKWIGKEVSPNPKIAAAINDAKNKAAAASAGEPIDGNGAFFLTQVGGLMGSTGAAIGGGVGVAINLLSMFSGGYSSPNGVADVTGTMRFGRFFRTTEVGVDIYAASNVSEKPEDLFYAGAREVAESLKEYIYRYHININLPFDMPISPELAAKGKMWWLHDGVTTPSSAQPAPSIVFKIRTIPQNDVDITKLSGASGQGFAIHTTADDNLVNRPITLPSSTQPAPSKPAQNAAQADSDCTDPCADCPGKPDQDTAQVTPK